MENGILAQLLAALEKTPPMSRFPILAELVHHSREPIEGQWKYAFHQVRYAAIEIIKSGIFVEDRLKGRKVPSIPPKFITYPIKDPEGLVWEIALPLGIDIEKKIFQISIDCQKGIKRCFTRMVVNMDQLDRVIETWVKPKTKQKIDKIKAALDSLKEELLLNVPKKFFSLKDPIDYMIDVFKKHVPEAPNETIARRVTDIFKISHNITVRYQSVLQRMNRRNQQRT